MLPIFKILTNIKSTFPKILHDRQVICHLPVYGLGTETDLRNLRNVDMFCKDKTNKILKYPFVEITSLLIMTLLSQAIEF